MFNKLEKQKIAEIIEKALLELNHPSELSMKTQS